MITAFFFIGFVVVVVFEMCRWGVHKLVPPPPPPGGVVGRRPMGERIRFAAYLLCFIGAPFIGAWIALSAPRQQFLGVAMLVAGVMWLFLGLTPVAVCMVLGEGRLASFRRTLEYYSERSFTWLVRLWLFALALAVYAALRWLYLA
jgi:hypothetical protein